MAQPSIQSVDPLESLLSLENDYYSEGYTLGLADGARAGRTEGRIFGLAKGYEKHVAFGKLSGHAAVWNARLSAQNPVQTTEDDAEISTPQDPKSPVAPLEATDRLRKHIQRLRDLTDASTLSTENSEEAVEEFESRLKDARAKATLIAKAVGEDGQIVTSPDAAESSSKANTSRGLKVNKAASGQKGSSEMEDFVGTVPISKTRVSAD